MTIMDSLREAASRVSLGSLLWYALTAALWPAWLLLGLAVQVAVYIAAGAIGAPTLAALAIAGLVVFVAILAGSWFIGGTTAVNRAPGRLWLVPAAYGAASLAALAVIAVIAWVDGQPGPWPWSTPTTVGVVFIAAIGVVPAAAAFAFLRGVRAAAAQLRDEEQAAAAAAARAAAFAASQGDGAFRPEVPTPVDPHHAAADAP